MTTTIATIKVLGVPRQIRNLIAASLRSRGIKVQYPTTITPHYFILKMDVDYEKDAVRAKEDAQDQVYEAWNETHYKLTQLPDHHQCPNVQLTWR